MAVLLTRRPAGRPATSPAGCRKRSVCQASERRYKMFDELAVPSGSVIKTERLHRSGRRGAVVSPHRR